MGATLACSYAFMLPAATAPNAIVKQSGDIPVSFMIPLGFIMNILCIASTVAWTNYAGGLYFKLEPPYEPWLADKLDAKCVAGAAGANDTLV